MAEREKVIKALEHCVEKLDTVTNKAHGFNCTICPYFADCDSTGYLVGLPLMLDALALLKAQEPRMMKVGEVRNWVHSDRTTREPIFIEMRSGVCAWIIDDEIREIPGAENLTSDSYSKTWRCWTSRPTDGQREATAWQS